MSITGMPFSTGEILPPVWYIERKNDVGPDDDGFWEWWEVTNGTDGNTTFKSDCKEHAEWLAQILNSQSSSCPAGT